VLDALLERAVSTIGAARLVHHAEHAGAGEQVLWLAPMAAREAAALGAHKEAVAHFAAALRFESALSAAERAELLEAYSYELHLTGEIESAVQARSGSRASFVGGRSPARRRGPALALAPGVVAGTARARNGGRGSGHPRAGTARRHV
jgi:hypothetical protein